MVNSTPDTTADGEEEKQADEGNDWGEVDEFESTATS